MHRLIWKSLLVKTAVALAGALLPAGAATAQTVFINEVHYDNQGKDTGEIVEVAGPAKTDLTDWKLVLYNGKNGRPYRTVALEGSIPDLQAGYGVLSFETKGLENGAPDGMALVDAADHVVHFLSYEGNFTASEGAASGLPSKDVGAQESNSTAPGHSIQLKGMGGELSDFQWEAPAPASPGAVNDGQTFRGTALEGPDGIAHMQ